MKGIFRYLWYTNKKNIIIKLIFQFMVVLVGNLTVILIKFFQVDDSELYTKLNILFAIIILFFSIDVYIQCYENLKSTRFDRYIAGTTIGLTKLNDCLVIFDLLFLIYSFILGNVYLIQTNYCSHERKKYEIQLFFLTLLLVIILKIVCVISMILFHNVKIAILTVLFLNVIFMKFIIGEKIIEYIWNYKILTCLVVICFVILYNLEREKLMKFWKEGL